jgi:hypothetical protein
MARYIYLSQEARRLLELARSRAAAAGRPVCPGDYLEEAGPSRPLEASRDVEFEVIQLTCRLARADHAAAVSTDYIVRAAHLLDGD